MHNGTHLKQARENAGLSIRKLAEVLEVEPSTISRIENGQRGLTTHLALAVELVLGLERDTLVRHADDLSDNVRALIPGFLNRLMVGLAHPPNFTSAAA